MENIDKQFNMIAMRELGFDIGPLNRLIDQDTGEPVVMNGIPVVAPGCYVGAQCIEFDPYNNRKMMTILFSYFAEKHEAETGVRVMVFAQNNFNDGYSNIECRMSDNSIIKSKMYKRDSLRYLDLMMQMNDGPGNSEDLSMFDGYPDKPGVKKKTKRKVR